jgi:hypothetical protein
VGENELLYVACGRERCRFRRSKMAVVERHLCIAIEKRRLLTVAQTAQKGSRGYQHDM